MGNAIISSRGHGRIKVMKLDGEILKFKAPVTVGQIVGEYPNHVILHSEAVRHLGVRAKPLDECTPLKPKHLYFLVQLPKLEESRAPRRVRSGITMNAKSRLESMLLARRSVSDISVMTSSTETKPHLTSVSPPHGDQDGAVRLKVRLTKAQLAKLMSESQNSGETAERILDMCLSDHAQPQPEEQEEIVPENNWKPALRSIPETCKKAERSRVRFRSMPDGQVF
eukprot:Gb_39534 [translate_table: standard]